MAVTAKFQADFSDFDRGVKQAEAELKDFAGQAGVSERALKRMVDNFSGRTLIRDAAIMAEAIEKVGGTTKLTADELARMGAKAQEATAKMKAMGIEVPPGLQKIADEAKKVGVEATKLQGSGAGGFGGLIGTASKLAGAFGIGFGTAQVIRFGKEIIDLGGHLTDLSAKTGISVESLQVLGAAAANSGSTIDDVAKAVRQLQNRLASGDESAVKAVDALGLSLDQLLASNPTDLIKSIAQALADIEDPAIRAATEIDLIGKTQIDMAALSKELDKVTTSVRVMSKETAEALDQMAEKFGGFFRNAKAGVADFAVEFVKAGHTIFTKGFGAEVQREADATAASIKRVSTEAKHLGVVTAKPFTIEAPSPDKLIQLDAQLEKHVEVTKKRVEAEKKVKKEIDDAKEAAQKQLIAQVRLTESTTELKFQTLSLAEAFGQMPGKIPTPQVKDLAKEVGWLASSGLPDLKTRLQDVGLGGRELAAGIEVAAKETRGLSDSLKSIASGDFKKVFGDIGNFFKTGFKDIGVGFLESIGSGLLNALSSLLGKGLQLLGKGLSKLFGFDKEAKQVNALRDAFQRTFGTFEDMHQAFIDAGVDMEKFLNIKKVEDFNAALDDFNDALAFQDEAMRELDEVTKKYGFTLDELGPTLQKQKLDEQAAELYRDFQILTAGGVEAGAALIRMSDAVNAFVQDAQRLGTEVPEDMRPMIQRMIDMGLLLDENGEAITDIADVKFGESMSQQFQKVIGKIDELVTAITRGLAQAIRDIPDPHITGHVDWDVAPVPDAPSPEPGGGEFSTGGRLLAFPTRTSTPTAPPAATAGDIGAAVASAMAEQQVFLERNLTRAFTAAMAKSQAHG